MCSIFGLIGAKDPQAINNMCRTLNHRGPDDEGTYFNGEVALGNNRLSIVDLSPSGHQPMSNEDGRLWLVFNGEIYNAPELLEELAERGHHFRGHSDGETVLHLYEDYQEECLQYLRGMFAFALWDQEAQRLFCARDRFGIKPFYYAQGGKSFLFASELKAMLASGLVKREIDPNALSHYLSFGSVPAPFSMVKGIRVLPPASYLLVDKGRAEVHTYWHLNYPEDYPRLPEGEWVEQLNYHLRDSVRLHLRSDVPVGVFLSGGTDSSALLHLMREFVSGEVKTFSIGFDVGESQFDELCYARQVAQWLGTDHHETIISDKEVTAELEEIIKAIDQPSHDGINSYFIAKIAAEDLKVALSGLGGDELFAGYGSFRFARRIERWKHFTKIVPNIWTLLVDAMDKELSYDLRRHWIWQILIRGLSGCYPSSAEVYALRFLYPLCDQERLLQSDVLAEIGKNGGDALSLVKGRLKGLEEVPAVHQMGYLEATTYMQETLLRDTDAMSMAHSLEVRVPFVDHILAEFVARIPPHLKLKGDTPKYILRRAVSAFLPKGILNRPKMGFSFPLGVWMRGRAMKEIVQDCLFSGRLERRGLFRPKGVENVYQAYYGPGKIWSNPFHLYQRVWMLTVFELWCRAHIDGF